MQTHLHKPSSSGNRKILTQSLQTLSTFLQISRLPILPGHVPSMGLAEAVSKKRLVANSTVITGNHDLCHEKKGLQRRAEKNLKNDGHRIIKERYSIYIQSLKPLRLLDGTYQNTPRHEVKARCLKSKCILRRRECSAATRPLPPLYTTRCCD